MLLNKSGLEYKVGPELPPTTGSFIMLTKTVLLRDGRYDQCWIDLAEDISQRFEL
jgi:hypothetical protein